MRRLIIAPLYRQAVLFVRGMDWNPMEVRVALNREHLLGLRLDDWEVWWLDRMWPCRTHEDVARMEEMKLYARMCGADLRRWWT